MINYVGSFCVSRDHMFRFLQPTFSLKWQSRFISVGTNSLNTLTDEPFLHHSINLYVASSSEACVNILTFGNKFQFLVCKILYSTKDLPECNNRIRLPRRERLKYGVRWHFHYPPYRKDSSNKWQPEKQGAISYCY